ncbi:MAG: RagB/SusD family nutrient uptake outer membrane protein [Prevotella sp.]|nr:RagB/SusD family nutrient uptake outer membrane protein [Prevotella sp.]
MKTSIIYNVGRAAILGAALVMTSCSRSFLDPDPLSVFEPGKTFKTESGLQASMAICDRQIKLYYAADHNEMTPVATEFMFSEMLAASATDKVQLFANIADMLTPNSDDNTANNLDRQNSIWHFWMETYNGIKNANTIIAYAPTITTLSEEVKNKYIGQAYFHRAFRYYALVFQYGDVPLVTKLPTSPKQDYKSTKRDAILKMLQQNMEFAVQWVPDQKQLNKIGEVNKGACRMLLSKIYLALGEYQKAKEQLDIIIDQSGYSLMTDNFGTFNDGGEPKAWPIKRNVIWDMHRAENKLISANKEVIMGIPDRGLDTESFTSLQTMRIFYPFFFNNGVKTTDGKQALLNLRRNHKDYEARYDYMRALGRGVATWRLTTWAQKGEWYVNGKLDKGDLRHSVDVGNWVCMDSLICNNKASVDYGKHIRLYDDNGKLLCNDSIRRWYDFPHYKLYLDDPVNEANVSGSDGYRGATNGGNADWYLYRLAEAYLLRAEAKFYIDPTDPTIADDVNIIRQRAHCTEMYPRGQVTIGDIMDERARELFMEEWRNVELKRVSLCLARSGRPDEWGNTYSLDTFDKQEGTDAEGGSYWYQRLSHLSMYNKGEIHIVSSGQPNVNYRISKHNMYWPIPEDAIVGNNKGVLHQNFGYTGYDPNVEEFDTWEEAVADEQ